MLQVHSPLRKVYRGCGNLGDFDFQLDWSVSGQALERVTGHCDLPTKLVTQKTASSSIAMAKSHTTVVSDGLGHTYSHVNMGWEYNSVERICNNSIRESLSMGKKDSEFIFW